MKSSSRKTGIFSDIRRFRFGFREKFGLTVGGSTREFFLVGADHFLFQMAAEVGIDRMDDVTVGTVGVLAAGHNDEVLVTYADYFDVMECELVVEGDGYDGLHRAFFK